MATATDIQLEDAIRHLRGPVHGTLVALRDMCAFGEQPEAIDRKVIELEGLVDEVVEVLDGG
jgi:hypothetical protein